MFIEGRNTCGGHHWLFESERITGKRRMSVVVLVYASETWLVKEIEVIFCESVGCKNVYVHSFKKIVLSFLLVRLVHPV